MTLKISIHEWRCIKNRWLFHCHVSLEDFVVSKVWNGRTLCLTDLLSADCEVKLLNLMCYRQDQVKHFRTLACAFWGPKFGTFHKANSWGLLCVGLFQIKLNHLLGSHHQLHHVIAWAVSYDLSWLVLPKPLAAIDSPFHPGHHTSVHHTPKIISLKSIQQNSDCKIQMILPETI